MTSDAPLYQRDPEAWQAHLAEGNRKQARKRVGADVLFRDDAGRILLVDPRYKPDWIYPAGWPRPTSRRLTVPGARSRRSWTSSTGAAVR